MKALLIAIALVLVAGIASEAAAPDAIHGCYRKKSGALRVADKCWNSEAAITWNQQGPTGPEGPAGPGARNAFEVLSGTFTATPETLGLTKTITCPEGMTMIAGTSWVTVQANVFIIPVIITDAQGVLDYNGWGWAIEDPGDSFDVAWTLTCAVI